MIRNLLSLCFIILICFSTYSQNSVADSLENVLKKEIPDSIRVAVLSDLCWEYRQKDQKKALRYGKEAVTLAEKKGDKKGMSKSLNDLSIIYMDKTQLDTAILLLNRALLIRIDLKDSVGQAAVYNKLGIIYQNRLNLSEALGYSLKALALYEALKMSPHIRTTMNNIGIIHYNLRNFDKSLAIHSELMDLRVKANDRYGIAQSMLNIGNVHIGKGDTLKGMDYYQRAAPIFRQLNRKEELAVVLNNLGAFYNLRKGFRQARVCLEESLAIRRELNKPKEICSALILLGELNSFSRNYKQANSNLREALAISKQYALPLERLCYQKLAAMYRDLNKADSTFYYYSMYEVINNKLYEDNIKNEVAALQTKYETEKKEQEIQSLNQTNTIQQLSISRQRLYFGGGFVILVLVGSFGYQFQRSKRLKEKIKMETALKETQEHAATSIIETELNERRRIAAELHDGVVQTFSAAKMNLSGINGSIRFSNPSHEKVYEDTMNMIDEGCSELRSISHSMMPEALLKKGLPEALRDLVARIDSITINLGIYGFHGRFNSRIETSVYRIIQESVNNALKHAAATTLDIQLNMEGSDLNITIEDNGKGFDASSISQSPGIGLKNINSRVNLLSGQIDIDSKPGKGTLIAITIPMDIK